MDLMFAVLILVLREKYQWKKDVGYPGMQQKIGRRQAQVVHALQHALNNARLDGTHVHQSAKSKGNDNEHMDGMMHGM